MFDWFKSSSKKTASWRSIPEMLKDLSRTTSYRVRNRAYFSDKNFRKFIQVIERSGIGWIELSRSPDGEQKNLKDLMYVTTLNYRGKPKAIIEVLQHPCGDGTMVYFIDFEKATSCQMKLLKACLECEINKMVHITDMQSDDALDAMNLLVDFKELYSSPPNIFCEVERYKDNFFTSISTCYRSTAYNQNNGQKREFCFEISELTGSVMLTRLPEVPSRFQLNDNIYKKIRTIY